MPSPFLQPREYPMPFARALARMSEDLKKTGQGQPQLPAVVPKALETFQSMAWGEQPELWQYVNLSSVFEYVRGGKALRIPSEWAEVIPKSFPGDS